MQRTARICALPVALLWLSSAAVAQVKLGDLETEQHQVAGEIWAIDTKTLECRGCTYDGQGPDAFFWGDKSNLPSSSGYILAQRSDCGGSPLGRLSGDNVVIELPDGLSVADLGYVSVWCRQFSVSFGGLGIDKSLVEDLPEADTASLQCAGKQSDGGSSGEAEAGEPFPVKAGFNCEDLLEDRYQVRWRVDGSELEVELVGRIASNEYMGFGPSGEDDRSFMVGADPVIAFEKDGKFMAVDFMMTSRAQCNNGEGVCPDTAGSGSDDVTNVEGSRSGDLVRISYKRRMEAIEELDRSFSTDGETFIAWAIGPVNEVNGITAPQFHDANTVPRGQSVSFNMNRDVENKCAAPLESSDQDKAARPEPWDDRDVIAASPDREIVAVIGPSGGAVGVSAITNRDSWGIAWYMDDIMIATIGVERGKKYRFRVMGGDDESNNSKYHPLYITSSPEGGLGAKGEGAKDGGEVVYAGPTEGTLCEYKTTDSTPEAASSFGEYFDSLNTTCKGDEDILSGAGTLEWEVAANTPDEVYYQCYTHAFLGWKIRVFDEGRLSEEALRPFNVEGRNGAERIGGILSLAALTFWVLLS